MPFGVADVVVTDGFSGNLILKFAEGFGAALMDMLKSEVKEGGLGVRLGGLPGWSGFPRLKGTHELRGIRRSPFIGIKTSNSNMPWVFQC